MYQVDQSGKIEDTAKPTVIAFSNKNIGAIVLPSKEKRRLQEMFRHVGAPRLFIDYTFAVLLIFLIKPLKTNKVIVDREYQAHEKIIESLVRAEISTEIEWRCVGKNSKAHEVVHRVFIGKLKIGKKVKAKEVWKMAKKITGGYLKTGLSPANRYSAPVNK